MAFSQVRASVDTGQADEGQPLKVRGMLPWHNFLCGPTAWNESDYRAYLDEMKAHNLNLIAFHNYTGGGQRYITYVEPMIRIEYRDVVGQATFDTSLTARWGYRPLAVEDFVFGSRELFSLPAGVTAFGADCAIQARTNEDRYEKAQGLMQKVLAMAHERGIQMAMGFEFGIHPPEFMSIVPGHTMLDSSGILDPTSPAAIGLLHRTIDNLLIVYPALDQIWLWLHEHTMYTIGGKGSPVFQRYLKDKGMHFGDDARFNGVWSLLYIQEAYTYLKRKAPHLKLVISGWGGGVQLPKILKGLDVLLPRDITFSCLNPGQGTRMHDQTLADIATRRAVWSIPWLEGDAAMWHLQPRVHSLVDQVRQAETSGHEGVLAIHWRTRDVRANFEAYAWVASRPRESFTTEVFYRDYCGRYYGPKSRGHLAARLARMDREQWLHGVASPEYFPYDPTRWGKLDAVKIQRVREILAAVEESHALGLPPEQRKNLQWLRCNLQFFLQLDKVSRTMEPAYILCNDWLTGKVAPDVLGERGIQARVHLNQCPVKALFETYMQRVSSRGELGVLSSLNQRVWLQFRELDEFLKQIGSP
jgi:hypothetical protein